MSARVAVCAALRTICVLLAAGAVTSTRALAQDRPLTIDQMLKVEGIGAAFADPQGEWLVFERLRPYDEIHDFSFRTYAARKSGQQVWRVSLHGGAPAELLPGLDQEAHTYLEAFSPSGSYLSLFQYEFGRLSLALYHMQTGRTVRSAHPPAIGRAGEHTPVWINESELVFAALPDGQAPALASVRAEAARRLTAAWEAAFRGTAVTASEVRTWPSPGGAGDTLGRLVRLHAGTGDETVIATGLFTSLRLSPDGRYLAALAVSEPALAVSGSAPAHDLQVVDLQTGDIDQPAQGIEFSSHTLDWSPDGRRLAAFGWDAGGGAQEGRFHVIDLESGVAEPYPHYGLDLASERERGWRQRPERAAFLGNDLAVFARPGPAGQYRFSPRDIAPADLEPPGWYRVTRTGDILHLTTGLRSVSPVPISSGPGHLTIAAAGGIYQVGRGGIRTLVALPPDAAPQLVTPSRFSVDPSVARPDHPAEVVLTYRGSGVSRGLILGPGSNGSARTFSVAGPSGNARVLAGSLRAGSAYFLDPAPPLSALVSMPAYRDAVPVVLARINQHLGDTQFGNWERVAYDVSVPGSGGGRLRLESCVLLPAGFDPRRPPPLVVDVYPGNISSCRTTEPDFSAPNFFSPYLWAGRGFAYARLATPPELIRTEEGPIAGIDETLDAGVSALVGAGYAEEGRISLAGFSQGAAAALYTAARSDRFNAVIAINGWSDYFSHYFGPAGVYAYFQSAFGAFDRYEPLEGTDFGFGHTPFENAARYVRNSPVFLAPDISAPVLLIHSDLDSFSHQQFDEMFGALMRSGKDARYVRYWGEGHGPSAPPNIRDMWDRMDAFLLEQNPRTEELR